ncbi:MAG: HIT domain-containing protein [Alphaproteobacteria bacterium]|jgi:histidine triad (HIT) family protein|nr:HIT domain-containing protein [Alphaproteobacteria bacterium]MBT5827574.1 HIT domain-containing protein [Alphaproteobacteria bacterium]
MLYDKNNIFAKIIRGELPCAKIFEDEKVLAFNDINPAASKHILVVPKGEYISFDDFIHKADDFEVVHFFKIVRKITHDYNMIDAGYRIISNHGKDASQTVDHFHIHILAGERLGGLLAGDNHAR